MNTKRIIYIILLMLSVWNATAQNTYLLYDLRTPQRLDENPGCYAPYKFHIGFPALSRVQAGADSPLSYGEIMMIQPRLMRHIHNNNYTQLGIRDNLIDFGFRIKHHHYLFFTATAQVNALVNVKKGFFDFIIHGNADHEGESMQLLGNDAAYAEAYIAYGIGYNMEVNNHFSWGIKLKYLMGIGNMYTSKAHMELTTAPNYDSLSIDYGFSARMNNIDYLLQNDYGNYIMQTLKHPNHGAAIDVGLRYRVHRYVELSLACADIGFIRWQQATQASVDYAHINYTGPHMYGMDEKTSMEDCLEEFTDSLKRSFEYNTDTVSIPPYSEMISMHLHVGGYLYASRNDRFGLYFHATLTHGRFIPSGTISYHRTCGKWVDFTIGNTFKSNSWLNPGVGISFHFGVFQMYIMADYINSTYIDRIRNINAVVGINFTSKRYPYRYHRRNDRASK